MNKRGFLLLECACALILLISLTTVYGWYLCHSWTIQTENTTRLQLVTAMSNYLEQMYHTSDSPGTIDIPYSKKNIPLPTMSGAWESLVSELSTHYRLVEVNFGEYLWHVGMIQ